MTTKSLPKDQSLLKKLDYTVTTVTYAGIPFVTKLKIMYQEADPYPVLINVFSGERRLDTSMH